MDAAIGRSMSMRYFESCEREVECARGQAVGTREMG